MSHFVNKIKQGHADYPDGVVDASHARMTRTPPVNRFPPRLFSGLTRLSIRCVIYSRSEATLLSIWQPAWLRTSPHGLEDSRNAEIKEHLRPSVPCSARVLSGPCTSVRSDSGRRVPHIRIQAICDAAATRGIRQWSRSLPSKGRLNVSGADLNLRRSFFGTTVPASWGAKQTLIRWRRTAVPDSARGGV